MIQQHEAFKNWFELSEPHGPTVFWAMDSLQTKWFQDYEHHSTNLSAKENLAVLSKDQTRPLLLNNVLYTHMTLATKRPVFVVTLC